jgi:hypothetical protein
LKRERILRGANMDEKFLITGGSLMDLLTYHPDIADEVIGLSVITYHSIYEFGSLLMRRLSQSTDDEEIHKLIEVGTVFMIAISHMEKLTFNMSVLEPILSVGVYKKINFVQSSYIFEARENNLILICNEREIQDAIKEVGIYALFTGNKDFEKKFTQLANGRLKL